ncbi:MAG: phenylalanine--tRNA ligase beta subunit-related protein [Lachnoclostridium sp.]|nr:phenylalanine--tRNA ligase beta subunit-related protein [Lachnoclostridium sp.]
MKIEFEDVIKSAAPDLHVITLSADVTNGPTSDELWNELEAEMERIAHTYQLQEINSREGIRATRQAYKTLGKEPNRYRPSAEALSRRAVKGMGLYRVTTLVDLINLLSLWSGYSIGGFDHDKISGDTLRLGAGREGEDFEAIGRGQLNIARMPIYRDEVGGIGTPTSDNERTKLDPSTRRLLMVVNIYGREPDDDKFINKAKELLTRYAAARNIEVNHYNP